MPQLNRLFYQLMLCGALLLPGRAFSEKTVSTDERYLYEETSGSKSVQYQQLIKDPGKTYFGTIDQEGLSYQLTCSKKGGTLNWSIVTADSKITAELVDDNIVISGRRDGKTVSKEHSVKSAKWYQLLSISLRYISPLLYISSIGFFPGFVPVAVGVY